MFLWQSLAGSFYAPCVDGDYGFGVFGDELGHTLFRVRRPCDARPAVNALVVAFAVLAGVAGSVQVAVMAKLGDRVGVFGALAWATTLAALLALALLLVAKQSLGPFADAARQPVWLWSGAIMSVIIVLAITVAGSRIGVIATVSILLAGQFAAGAAIDRYGLLGADRIGVGWWRVFGIVLLGIGAGLTLKK